MALLGIPIDPQECIGDSLTTLNNSFIELDSRTLSLSANDSNLYSLVQSTSGSLNALTQSTSGSLYTLIQTTSSVAASSGVTQIIAGSNITISPVGGTGVVTINSTGGGGGGSFSGTSTATTLTADDLFLRVEVGPYYKYIRLNDINGVYNESI